jgi:hypothetical protein
MAQWPSQSMKSVKAMIQYSPLIVSPRFQTDPRQGDIFTKEFPGWKHPTWDDWKKYIEDQYSALWSFTTLNHLFIPSDR